MIPFLLSFVTLLIWAILALASLDSNATSNASLINKILMSYISCSKQFFAALTQHRPISYIIAYVIEIVLFATIYWLLPNRSFYHATAMYERGPFSEDAIQILMDIRQIIVESSKKTPDESIVIIDDWALDIDEIRVHSLEVENFPEEVSFKIIDQIYYSSPDIQFMQTDVRAKIIIKIFGQVSRIGNTVFLPIVIEEEKLNSKFDKLPEMPNAGKFFTFGNFPLSRSNWNSGESTAIFLPIDLYKRILDFGEGYRGFPTGVSGQVSRMLYFSAGIATSNAFGDIVPITTTARAFVFLQGLVTLLIVGFFLNAVGQSIAKPSSDSYTQKSN